MTDKKGSVTPVEPAAAAVPMDLDERGAAFWRSVVDVYELSEAESALLLECCRLLDETELLAAAVRAEGVTVEGSAGQPRAHPALAELRQLRIALSRLLAQLDLETEDGSSLPSLATLKARRAAEARWRTRRRA